MDQDGYVRVLGRSDDIIIVAGRRLGTREIEEVLLSHPAIAEVAVIGVSSELRGQVPIAFAVLSDQGDGDAGALLLLEANLIKTVNDVLGSSAKPKKIVFVNALPRTRSGKVLRRTIQGIVDTAAESNLANEINEMAV